MILLNLPKTIFSFLHSLRAEAPISCRCFYGVVYKGNHSAFSFFSLSLEIHTKPINIDSNFPHQGIVKSK